MESVLMSIQPKWVEKIITGKKTVEVRKTRPKIETPFKCYIYMTATGERCRFWEYITAYQNSEGDILDGSQKVIGEFVCNRIDRIGKRGINSNFDYCYLSLNKWGNDDIEIEITDIQKSCISKGELNAYGANSFCLYAWHISNLKIYDKPKELSEFYTRCNIPENKCKLCDNCFDREDNYGRHYAVKKLTRPPQSWCYVEEL